MNDLKLENDRNDKKGFTVITTFQYPIIKVLSLPGPLKNQLETDLDVGSLEPFFQMGASQSAMVFLMMILDLYMIASLFWDGRKYNIYNKVCHDNDVR